MANLHVARRRELELDVALILQKVPGNRLELVEPNDWTVGRVVGLAILVDRKAGHVLEGFAARQRVADVAERELALADADGVRDAALDVHLRRDAREPAAPDDRQVRVLLAHHLRRDIAVVDLVAEDAGRGEEQRALAGLVDLSHVVRLDHRVDQDDLEAVCDGARCDLKELERQEVRTEPLAARRIGAVRKEQDDLLLALDHGKDVGSEGAAGGARIG